MKTTGNYMVYGADGERIAGFSCESDKDKFEAADDMLEALKGLFQNCAFIHKYWGDGDNRQAADMAVEAAKAAIAKAEGR